MERKEVGLNPCFNGRYSQSTTAVCVEHYENTVS